MAKLSFQVFVSSPGDVGDERRIAVRVLERLQGKYGAFVSIRPIVWEHEPVRATATFQQQIASPSESDVMVCILWSRLGTRLPADFRRPDGSTYDSGTAFEFESARAAHEREGRPDLLVYRKTALPIIDVRDRRERELRSAEWDRLAEYLDHWFRNPDGSFRAGFTVFERLDEFEDLLERHLDSLIQDRLAKEHVSADVDETMTPTWLHGSPFRGLEVFEVEHSGIFHGRTRAVAEVKDRLSRRALDGTAFLLVYGMSGSGKSSLVRAGVVPAIIEPGVVEGIGLWRYGILRPTQGADPLAALIATLSGPTALPELTEGDFTLEELQGLVRESPDRIVGPVRGALGRAAERLQASERLTRLPAARLAVVVDQLEELFTDARSDAQVRQTFIAVLASLSRSGLVWVICTMRSDFFHRCAEVPVLAELKDGLGSYELLPPAGPEIAQMIRNPALAAGLRFEEDPDEGRLDDVLHEAAARDPASLPLMEFVLEALYQASGHRRVLTFAAYRALDRLEGAIARRADDVLGSLPAEVRNTLPALIRALVTVRTDEGTATARVARLKQVRAVPQRAALVDALIGARLLVSDGEDEQAVVRVAHEALLNRWPQAQDIIRESRDDLMARERASGDAALWERDDHAPDLLLPPGKRLAEAADLLARTREELDDRRLVEYIEASLRADDRRRRQRTSWIAGAFVVLVGLLGAAVWQWQEAREQTRVAREQTRQAELQAALALSRQIATHSAELLAQGDHQLALLLAVEAFRREETREASAALKAALEKAPLLERTLWVPAARDLALAFSPDGERIAVYRRHYPERPVLSTFELASGRELSSWTLDASVERLAWGDRVVGAIGGDLLVFDEAGAAERIPLPECGTARELGADKLGVITIACYRELKQVTTEGGRRVQTSSAYEKFGYIAALSGKGRHALVGPGEPSVWRVGESELRPLQPETQVGSRISERLAIDDTGRRLAVPTTEGTLIWALDGPSVPLAALPTQGRPVDLAFSPDGRRLAITYQDGRIELWAVGTVHLLAQPVAARRQDDSLRALALSPDRTRLAAGTETGFLTVERLGADGNDVQILSGWPGPIRAPLFLPVPPGATASAEHAIVVVEEGDGLIARRVSDRAPVGEGVRVEGRFLAASAGEDGRVRAMVLTKGGLRIANLTEGDVVDLEVPGALPLDADQTPAAAGALSRDGKLAAFVDGNHHLWFFDLHRNVRRGIQLQLQQLATIGGAFRVAITDVGSATVVVGRGGQWSANPLHVWVPDDGSLTSLWEGAIRYNDLFDVAISADGRRIVAPIYRVGPNHVLVWQRDDDGWRETAVELDGNRIAIHPEGTSFAVVDQQGEVSIGELSGALLRELQGPPPLHAASMLAYDRRGEFLAAASDRDVLIWRVGTGERLGGSENLLMNGVDGLAFEEGGRALTAAARGIVVRWSLDAGEPQRIGFEMTDEQPARNSCRQDASLLDLSPGVELALCTTITDATGVSLQLGMRDTWAVYWEVPTGDWLDRACRQAGRNLSPEEWTRYVGESVQRRNPCRS